MREYEKDHYDKFASAANGIVNGGMKRNILKLEFSHQIIGKGGAGGTGDGLHSPSPSMQSITKPRGNKHRPAGLGSVLAFGDGGGGTGGGGRRASAHFQRMVKLITWMSAQKHAQDQHLMFAEKILAATKSTTNIKVDQNTATEFSIQQAKCEWF